jgi:hypothetical protein
MSFLNIFISSCGEHITLSDNMVMYSWPEVKWLSLPTLRDLKYCDQPSMDD